MHGFQSPAVHSLNSFGAMKAMKVKGPEIMAPAGIIGFLNPCSRLRMRPQRLLPQVACLPRKFLRLRVVATYRDDQS